MSISTIRKFFNNARFKLFRKRRDREVHKILAQLNGRQDNGFPFATTSQMNRQTAARDLRIVLDLIEAQSPEMGEAYGEAFRYLMHRDIYDRLELYVRHVQRHIPHQSRVPSFAF